MIKIKTLFISDVHLGTKKSQPDKLLNILKKYEYQNLIINGDFIDLTSLKKKFYWKQKHTKIIQKILKLAENNVKVTYILGNHDFYLRELIEENNIKIGHIKICNELIHQTVAGEKIFICHGDKFDGFKNPILYNIGDFLYELSYRLNTFINFFRKIFGLKYWSLSKYLKRKVKQAVSYINDFKDLVTKEIERTNCDSIMIGHLHTPHIDKIRDNNYYYNTGDFCETCSYMIENLQGKIELHYCATDTKEENIDLKIDLSKYYKIA